LYDRDIATNFCFLCCFFFKKETETMLFLVVLYNYDTGIVQNRFFLVELDLGLLFPEGK
jgi:hypothetical protein